MRDKKYYIALDDFKRRVVVNCLNEMRNSLIANGKYIDAVDEVLLKIISSKQKKWHLNYLRESKRVLLSSLQFSGKLNSYLANIDSQAKEMFEQLVKQIATAEGITEQLKAENQMEWVAQMNSIRSRATEFVNNNLIFV